MRLYLLRFLRKILPVLIFAICLAGCSKNDQPTDAEYAQVRKASEEFLTLFKKEDFKAVHELMHDNAAHPQNQKPVFTVQDLKKFAGFAESYAGPVSTWKWQYEGKGASRDEISPYMKYLYKVTGNKGSGFMIIESRLENGNWGVTYFQFQPNKPNAG